LRETRGWKQSQAADIAARRGITLTYQTLRGLELGETQSPSPDALRAVAELYGVSYPDVVATFVRHAYGIDASAVGDAQLDLSGPTDEEVEDFTAVRLLADRIAAGPPIVVEESRIYGHLAFGQSFLEAMGVIKPVCVRVGARERSMLGTVDP